MSQNLPAWHSELRRNQTLNQWGFRWHSQRRLSRTPARADGLISLGSCPSVTTRHIRASILLDPSQPQQLWLDFCGEPDAPRLNCEPSFAALSAVYQRYFQRFNGRPQSSGINLLRQVVQLRSQPAPFDLETFLGDGYQQFHLFLGLIDDQTIIELENSMVFNPWLSLQALALDSGSRCGYSQYRTAFSGSILTMEFNRQFVTKDAACIARIAYHPVPAAEQANVQGWQMQNPANVAATLPQAVPFDVLGLYHHLDWQWWQTAEHAQSMADEGDPNAAIIARLLT